MPSIVPAINELIRREKEGVMTVDEAIAAIRRDKSLGAAAAKWRTDYVVCDDTGVLRYWANHDRILKEVISDYTLDPVRQGHEWGLVKRTDPFAPVPGPPRRINTGHHRQIMIKREDQICEE